MAVPTSHTVYQSLFDKGLVSDNPNEVVRCIVDLRGGEPVRILVERVGDERALSLGELLDGVIAGQSETDRKE